MTNYLTDAEGHRWPITGLWCDTCGMPLNPAIKADGYQTHPNCGEEGRA